MCDNVYVCKHPIMARTPYVVMMNYLILCTQITTEQFWDSLVAVWVHPTGVVMA